MTIYQIEQESGTRPFFTTDCRELLSSALAEIDSPFTLYISRVYTIEDKSDSYDDDEEFLELDSSVVETERTYGTSSCWTDKSYLTTYDCVRGSKKLIDETIHYLNLEDQVTSYTHDGRVYIAVTKEFCMTQLMLLITLILIYSETPEIESLEEYFRLGLDKISRFNDGVEPTYYAGTRMPAVLVLYYFYINKRQYSWTRCYYNGITSIPSQLYNHYSYTSNSVEWSNFKKFVLETVFNYKINIATYFTNYFRSN